MGLLVLKLCQIFLLQQFTLRKTKRRWKTVAESLAGQMQWTFPSACHPTSTEFLFFQCFLQFSFETTIKKKNSFSNQYCALKTYNHEASRKHSVPLWGKQFLFPTLKGGDSGSQPGKTEQSRSRCTSSACFGKSCCRLWMSLLLWWLRTAAAGQTPYLQNSNVVCYLGEKSLLCHLPATSKWIIKTTAQRSEVVMAYQGPDCTNLHLLLLWSRVKRLFLKA